jgi:uncharacterized protein YndB with AHSA1/START domain
MTTTRLIGSFRTSGETAVARLEDVYATTIDDLWEAITDPARLANWVATVDGDLHQGGAIAATFTTGFEGTGRIATCDPPHRLLVSMVGEDEPATEIETRLSVEGERTRLVVEERGIAPGDAPGYAAGWQVHLEGEPRADMQARWNELAPEYTARGLS